MRALVNGEVTELPEGTTVVELVRSVCGEIRGVAVALDAEVVPRSAWTTMVVPGGASIEILAAAAGG